MDTILILWNNRKELSPPMSNCTALAWANDIKIDVISFAHDTLLNRYKSTDSMGPLTLLQDDDVRYGDRAVRSFAAIAALFPRSIVGVNGRMAVVYTRSNATARYFHPDKMPGRYLNDSHCRGDGKNTSRYLYNMATGTTSILRRNIIERFTDVPQASRDYISNHKPTCEDITLHFLASNITKQPPIWFRLHRGDGGELDKFGDGDGVEMHLHIANWSEMRAKCVDRVTTEFGRFPLIQTNCRMDLHHLQLRHMEAPRSWLETETTEAAAYSHEAE